MMLLERSVAGRITQGLGEISINRVHLGNVRLRFAQNNMFQKFALLKSYLHHKLVPSIS